MPMIAEIPVQEANDYGINVTRVEQVRGQRGLGDKPECLIVGLRGSGLMSPKLRSLTEEPRAKARLYELKLSLSRNKERGAHE